MFSPINNFQQATQQYTGAHSSNYLQSLWELLHLSPPNKTCLQQRCVAYCFQMPG